eukprot:scaffold3486_cov185-Ochromonas_danica.AAC.9
MDHHPSWSSSLMPYILTCGDLLEKLELVFDGRRSFNTNHLVMLVAATCSKLTYARISNGRACSAENLRHLYEQCTHLQDVVIDGAINIFDNGGERRHYKKVTLRLRADYNHRVGNLKSMLEPYHIHLDASTTSESSFVSILQDLPHVNIIQLHPTVNNEYTDATLAAISKHANSLTELYWSSTHFSDKLLSELIKASQLLKVLNIVHCGLESFVAVSNHSNLREVGLITAADSVSEEVLNTFLLDEKVTWSPTLQVGYIQSYQQRSSYQFDKLPPHRWIKHLLCCWHC